MAKYTLEALLDQVERMRKADMPAAQCDPMAYESSLYLSAVELPKLSAKNYRLVMEMLFAAYQLGQIQGRTQATKENQP